MQNMITLCIFKVKIDSFFDQVIETGGHDTLGCNFWRNKLKSSYFKKILAIATKYTVCIPLNTHSTCCQEVSGRILPKGKFWLFSKLVY